MAYIDKLGVNQIDKVKELTNIDKNLGYNFWDQLEKPFLLCEDWRYCIYERIHVE